MEKMPSSLLEYIHFTINHRDHTIKLFAALFLLCYRLEVTQHSMTWLHSLDGRWGKRRDKQKATRELLHCRQEECGLLSKPSLWKWCYSKEKSHTDVQFRSRAVKQWHALAGLSKPIITWHSEVWVLWTALPIFRAGGCVCPWHVMQKKSYKPQTEQRLWESHVTTRTHLQPKTASTRSSS